MLIVEDLSVRYGAVQAVSSASLRVDEGEIVSLIGSNGAGKTTLMSTIMGLVTPTSGHISFKGRQITNMATEAIVSSGISLVPERRRIFSPSVRTSSGERPYTGGAETAPTCSKSYWKCFRSWPRGPTNPPATSRAARLNNWLSPAPS